MLQIIVFFWLLMFCTLCFQFIEPMSQSSNIDRCLAMREAGYIYPFDWRRRRMDRDYEEPQGIRISVDDWIDKRERYIAQRIFDWEHFYAYIARYNKLDMLEDHFP